MINTFKYIVSKIFSNDKRGVNNSKETFHVLLITLAKLERNSSRPFLPPSPKNKLTQEGVEEQ